MMMLLGGFFFDNTQEWSQLSIKRVNFGAPANTLLDLLSKNTHMYIYLYVCNIKMYGSLPIKGDMGAVLLDIQKQQQMWNKHLINIDVGFQVDCQCSLLHTFSSLILLFFSILSTSF